MTDVDLIELISQAVLDPSCWRRIATGFCRVFACNAVRISFCRAEGAPDSLAATADYAPPMEHDIAAAFRSLRDPELHTQNAEDSLAVAAEYADVADPPEYFHLMRLAPPARPGGITAIAIQYRRDGAGLVELARLRRIQRHLARAACMMERDAAFDVPGSCSREVLDALPFPILVVTEGAELRFANRAGADIAAASAGAIRCHDGRIEIVDLDLRARLGAAIGVAIAIAATTELPERDTVTLRDEGAAPALRIEIRPLRIRASPQAREMPAALVCLHPATPSLDAALLPVRVSLETNHSLTRAETEVALAILRGQTLAACAASRKVSVHTVRSQLRNVFTKTGCRRQADLVRLFLPAGTAA